MTQESANSLLWLEIRLFRATGKLERLEGLRREASGATWRHEKGKQFSSPGHSQCNSVSVCLIYCDSIKKTSFEKERVWAVLLKKKILGILCRSSGQDSVLSMVGKLRSHKLQCIAKKRKERKKAQQYKWNSGTKAKLQWVKQ